MTHPYKDIFDFITRQETAFGQPIRMGSKNWSFKDHIERSTLYRDSDIVGTKTKFTPVKNITRPILNVQYRTEDIDVKDVQIYINDEDKFHLSFLVKKYHDDVFVVENDLDTFFDQLNQSRIDYGVGLSKAVKDARENVPLASIAFCDQRDILSRPIGLKHSYSPDELLAMADKGWGDERNGATASLKETIILSRENQKDNVSEGDIEVYEVHGNLPKRFADPANDSEEYESRIFICCFYQKKNGEKEGIILYTAPEPESPFKVVKRDPIYGRAAGFGGAEEIFEDQTWTNYAQIRKLQMMDSASKTLLGAVGPNSRNIANKNNTDDLENNQILDLGDGDLKQIDTFPRNFQLFDKFVMELGIHAKEIGAAQDPLQGNEPSSGTPFASLQAQIQQGMGLHEYRRGQFAKHIEEIYRDDYIPLMAKKILSGTKFLSELSLEEMQMVSERVANNEANKMVKEKILSGQIVDPQEVEAFKKQVMESFKKKGNKHFIEILKGEFKNIKLDVKINIKGKQKDLAGKVDKLTNVFRMILSNPYMLQAPPIARLFNNIIEASGLDPIDLSNFNVPPLPTRRMTETLDYKDLPPEAQQSMLQLAGIDVQSAPTPQVPPAPQQIQTRPVAGMVK